MTSAADAALSDDGTARSRPASIDAPLPSVDGHVVQFYADDKDLTHAVGNFLGEGLSAGDVVVVIAVQAHERAFRDRLQSQGFDVDDACETGSLLFLDATVTLSRFMRDEDPDPLLFEDVVGQVIRERLVRANGARVRAYGEMVDVLWQRGARKGAVRLEELWNDLRAQHPFTLFCAYSMDGFYKEPDAAHLVCQTHTHVIGNGPARPNRSPTELQATGLPPQHAQRLAREIAHREEVERTLRESLRDLRAKDEELLRSTEEVRDLVENAVVGLHRVAPDGTILWANQAELQMLGYTAEEYVGHPLSHFYFDRDAVGEILARLGRGEALHDLEAQMRAKDGSVRHVLISSNAYFEEGKFVHTRCFTRDVTDRKNFEHFRAAAAERAEQLVKITSAIADAVTSDEVLQAVVDHVASALDASSAALWLVGPDERTIRLSRAVGYGSTASRELEELQLDANPTIPVVDAIRRREPIWIPSQEALFRDYPHLRAVATAGSSYRIFCLPLVSQDRTLGALGITIDEARAATEEERRFLLLVAQYAGQAIERLRLLDAERRSRAAADCSAARLAILGRASRAFGDADLDLSRRLEDIAREVGTATSSGVVLALIDAAGSLRTHAAYHPRADAAAALGDLIKSEPLVVGAGVSGRVAGTGEGILIPYAEARDWAVDVAPAYGPFLERFPVYAIICVPLRVRGKVIGTITAARTNVGETYATEDLELLQDLADRAAPAIENSRLHGENVVARERAEQLYHFAKSVVSAERVEEVFEAALDAIEGALQTNRGAILICDDQNVMRFRASRGLSESYQKAVEGHSPWLPGTSDPQPVLVADVERDAAMAAYLELFAQEQIGSLAFIPLVSRGRLIGKFMVYYGEPHEYPANEIELARSIANHLASVTARFTAIAKLEQTVRYNDLFAGVLAHDLRNPLGALLTSAQLLLRRQLGPDDRNAKVVGRILATGQRMARMIDQLLDLTRVRVGGGMQVERCLLNFEEICGQAIDELELAHPNWNIQRNVVGDQTGSWDPDRLLQIVSNLVGNAGQHGRTDTPIAVKLDGRNADLVTLDVHNEGDIPEAMVATLFDPFRGTGQNSGSSRGLGLGLFIVRELVRAHGGTVEVRSSPSAGTTFSARLPRRAPRSLSS